MKFAIIDKLLQIITLMESNIVLEEEQVIVQRLAHVIRIMRTVDTVYTEDESEDFMAGYIQALDDLLAWLAADFDL